MKKLDVASWIFFGLAVAGVVWGARLALGGGADTSWPAAARHHVVVGGLHLAILGLVTAIMAGGLRRRRRSAWITLAVVSVLGWGAFLVARALGGEPPAGSGPIVTAVALAASVVALGISYRPIFEGDGPATGRRSAPPVGE